MMTTSVPTAGPTATYERRRRTSTTKPAFDSPETAAAYCASGNPCVVKTRLNPPPAPRPLSKAVGEEDDIEDLFRFNGGSEEVAEIRAELLDWYDRSKRDLPWRKLGDDGNCDEERKAYSVWVSEVMLQQTRVATVIDYYNRWMEKWPSVDHLSRASMEEVNEMWAGLGYYRRARYLLEGAIRIAAEGGTFPRTASELRKIAGIGDYTSGAIASIAFNEPVPVVDGNVVRVLARLKAISGNPKQSLIVKGFWKLAEQLVDPCRPGDFNQALMELGATVCTPTSTSCSTCPVSSHCLALSLSKHCVSSPVTNYPQKVIKAKQRNEFSAVCVLEISDSLEVSKEPSSKRQYLLVKRPDEGLLAGLWEFPSVLFKKDVDVVVRRKAIDVLLKKSFNLEFNKTCDVILREDVGEYVHIFSHIRLKMYVEFLILHVKGGLDLSNIKLAKKSVVCKCVDSDDLSNIGLTSGVRKVYTMVQKYIQPAKNIDMVVCKSRKRSKKV